jgi:hypothetical protein
MAEPLAPRTDQPLDQAREQGRSEGLATAALALGALSFFQLLGAEKALLAIVLALVALRGARSQQIRRRGWAALVLGGAYLVVTGVTLVLYGDKLGELIRLLQTLG